MQQNLNKKQSTHIHTHKSGYEFTDNVGIEIPNLTLTTFDNKQTNQTKCNSESFLKDVESKENIFSSAGILKIGLTYNF